MKRFIGDRYREAWSVYAAGNRRQYPDGDPRRPQSALLMTSGQFLADHMAEVPVMVIPCIEGRVEGQDSMAMADLYGSIVQATWSFMLAARQRGLGSAYTTLHLRYEREVAEAVGLPYAKYTQAALLPVAYFTGLNFRPAERIPLDSIIHWERW
jgi:nitroreductase